MLYCGSGCLLVKGCLADTASVAGWFNTVMNHYTTGMKGGLHIMIRLKQNKRNTET